MTSYVGVCVFVFFLSGAGAWGRGNKPSAFILLGLAAWGLFLLLEFMQNSAFAS